MIILILNDKNRDRMQLFPYDMFSKYQQTRLSRNMWLLGFGLQTFYSFDFSSFSFQKYKP